MSIDSLIDKEIVTHIYDGILLSDKKEYIWVSSNLVDKPRIYYIEWSKYEEKDKYHILTYIHEI